MVRTSVLYNDALRDTLTPCSRFPPPLLLPFPVMVTSTEAVGYIPVPFLSASERAGCPDFRIAQRCGFCYSTTFASTGRGIGPIATRPTASTAPRTDTRRRGRANAIGYECSPLSPPSLPPLVVPFLVLIPTWRCHAITVIYFFLSHHRPYMKTAVC
jgi:hypothetical protein